MVKELTTASGGNLGVSLFLGAVKIKIPTSPPGIKP
jgi:hypothetical protein